MPPPSSTDADHAHLIDLLVLMLCDMDAAAAASSLAEHQPGNATIAPSPSAAHVALLPPASATPGPDDAVGFCHAIRSSGSTRAAAAFAADARDRSN